MTETRETAVGPGESGNGSAPPGSEDGREAVRSAHRLATERAQDTARRVHGRPSAPLPGPPYVGLVTRTIAFVVDAAILNTVAAVVAAAAALVLSVFPVAQTVPAVIVAVAGVLFVAWIVGYFATFWATTGQTPGNRVMQIQVMRPTGARPGPRRALLRVIGLLLAALPLFVGFVPILLTERRRGFADWLADTVVVRAHEASAQRDGQGS